MEPSLAYAILNENRVDKSQSRPEISTLATPPSEDTTDLPSDDPPPLLDNRITGANFFFANQLFRHELVRREHGVLNDPADAKIGVQALPDVPFLLPQDTRFTQRPQPLPLTTPRTTPVGQLNTDDGEKAEETRFSFRDVNANTAPSTEQQQTAAVSDDVTAPVFLIDVDDNSNQKFFITSTTTSAAEAKAKKTTRTARTTTEAEVEDARTEAADLIPQRQATTLQPNNDEFDDSYTEFISPGMNAIF
jgi:hypothetical protein